MNCEWVKKNYPLTEGIAIGIDQISITKPYKPPMLDTSDPTEAQVKQVAKAKIQYKHESLAHINYVRKTLATLFKATPPKPAKYGSKLDSIKVFCEEDGSHVATVRLGLHFGTPVLNYTLNPGKLTDKGFIELDALFCMTYPNDYEGLYIDGAITRFEFFIDVEGVKPADLVLLDIGKRKTTLYKGTTYHGRRGRPLVGTAYDKGAELKTDQVLTRIEARVKRRDMTFQQLVELGIPNPFAQFLVVPSSALETAASEWKYPELINQVRQHGLQGGIKNAPARKAITKRLGELVVPWWNPEHIWAEFSNIIIGFRPSFIGGGSGFSV